MERLSVKQDGARVRTAEDLERKYKLAEIRKMIEQPTEGITRINKILEDFVNTIVGTLENFEGISDGKIITYFHNGVPRIDTFPSNEWLEGGGDHINDLYYDRDTGKAYVFSYIDETMEWSEVTDKNKINVLAMANATVDTEDNKRVLYLENPQPPYDNGDLWLKDGFIYVCQISKPETESYEEHDFIVLSSYNGDTLAVKIGKSLEVLRGTVLKIIEDASQMNITIESLDDDTRSEIDFLKTSLSTLIRGQGGQSLMEQDENGIRFSITSILETLSSNTTKVSELDAGVNEIQGEVADVSQVIKHLEEKTAQVNIGSYEGQPTIELVSIGSDFKVMITNEEILFYNGTKAPAYINNNALFVEERLYIGNFSIVKRGNGHMSIIPKGVIK